MVVRFVCAVRVPLCVRVSRVCLGSPRCLFTGTDVLYNVVSEYPEHESSDPLLGDENRIRTSLVDRVLE